MTLVEEGEVEETIPMVEEGEQINLVREETEVPISRVEMRASIVVIIIEAEPTTGNGITGSDTTAMPPRGDKRQ